MNLNDVHAQEFARKLQRIHAYLEENNLDAVLIGTQANFSWLSCGGRSSVLATSELSDAIAVVTRDKRTLVAYTMDGERNRDEEMGDLGFDLVMTRWNEQSREQIVREMLVGKRFLSDIPMDGTRPDARAFYRLIYPLTGQETDRYRRIAKDSELILRSTVDTIRPGMTEADVEGLLISAFSLKGFVSTVVLVGSDERIPKYRHPLPSGKKIDRTVLLVLCPRKYGLHVPLTRTISFDGSLDPDMQRRFEAASTVAAHCIARSVPGTRFADVLAMQKRLYGELGYDGEWRNHFQGGPTGYMPNDSTLCLDGESVIQEEQPMNWFVTITGVNTEDTILSGKQGGEILTRSGSWPVKRYSALGKEVFLPEVLHLAGR